ncbi:forkhead box protein M1 isoform X2 [Centropristis striata]|uniref:forkhead box protein M1 isoform X2 n=1 Tax=Centropristis striata TaxID=184440 RepID=UPI0027E15188|nr:forkhead box protein M1 isoform X2 [Centropristis striata]
MTMRRSPRRPLILRRRKLPFQQNDPPAAESPSQADASGIKEPSKPASSQSFPDGIRIMDHPSMSDTQVVVIPKTADLQSVIGALTAKGKECGAQGPNKFILLSENSSRDTGSAAKEEEVSTDGEPVKAETTQHGSPDAKPLTAIKALNKELECGPLDDSLTNIQWLGRMNTCAFEADPAKQMANKENQNPQTFQAQTAQIDTEAVQQPMSERPPYSYMAMIQFAINSRKSRRMTLKEIYMWIEDHFPYFKEVAKPGWKNSIRHNLSLHDMFIRETSPDGKVSFWTIRPEANRCLTLDQVYKQQKRMLPDARKTPTSSERRMKPLLPRTDSYLVPIQLPVASSVYLPSSAAQFPPSGTQQKLNTSRGAKRVRIAPKVTQSDAPAVVMYPQKSKDIKVEVKEEQICVPIKPETPKAPPRRQASSSRRKQRLVHSVHEEPVLLCPDNTFFDSGVVSDASTFQEVRDTELDEHQQEQHSPSRDFSFKTPIKSSSSHVTSSTPSKPPSHVAPEPWKVTPVGKGGQDVLGFSPIRTPGGPAVTPRHDYNTFSFNSTPFKDWLSSPRELLTAAPPRAAGPTDSPGGGLRSGCSRELLQAGGAATPANRSITEGLVLDTLNDSLSKILVDISFSGLDDEDLGMANISWSEFFPQFK